MKIKSLLLSLALFTALVTIAQNINKNKSYAITGKQNNNFFWADIKQIDINTGKVIKTLFEAGKSSYKSLSSQFLNKAGASGNPTGNGVAACAFDKRHNRLYFAPMYFSDIKFLDLDKTDPTFTTIKADILPSFQTEDKNITRMVVNEDGYGYALTNDANHLIRFTTGKKTMVEDLGNLIDDEKNATVSIHNKCSGWGGDMVADAFGKLVVISANHNIFSINIDTRVTTLLGTISGLPANFTTNGAVVDDNGNLVVSSANVLEGLYRVNIKNWVAEKILTVENAFTASDLANANLLYQKEANEAKSFGTVTSTSFYTADSHVFPNPVTNNEFTISVKGQKAGQYNILLTDLSGKNILTRQVTIGAKSQAEKISFSKTVAKGMYLVKLTDDDKQVIFTEKIMVQ
ncbi:MAG: T9SS type A sorting domain-containing protein [Chitinophagaceae bacterium]|nr:T9SS type A sorting domain-containing protein [Chitinophagaceae bacterium]